MRRSSASRTLVTTLLLMATTDALCAQSAESPLSMRTMARGITLLLPTLWRPIGESERAASERRLNGTLAQTTDSTLRAALALGKPAILLRESMPGASDPSMNFNVAPTPGVKVGAFDPFTPDGLEAEMGDMCKVMSDFLAASGGRLLRCDRLSLEQVNGHTISVRRVLRAGTTGDVSVWIAQYPDDDVIYTLTLTAPSATAAQHEGAYASIMRSVRIPSWGTTAKATPPSTASRGTAGACRAGNASSRQTTGCKPVAKKSRTD